jgi:hypothetical protein
VLAYAGFGGHLADEVAAVIDEGAGLCDAAAGHGDIRELVGAIVGAVCRMSLISHDNKVVDFFVVPALDTDHIRTVASFFKGQNVAAFS